jgi:enoyl-[acyl-carrier protein] reductase III
MKHCGRLQGKVALITGSSRGIGRAVARRLATEGAEVVIHYRANRAAAEETANEVRQLGRDPLLIAADIRDPRQIKDLFSRIEDKHSALDILVSNAALGALKRALDLSWSKWDMTMEICARAFLLCAQEAVPLMKANGGRMIAISSLGSRKYVPNYTAIGAAKAALEAVTRYLAVELAQYRILVNAVCGGLIETPTLAHFPEHAQMMDDARTRCPLGRVGQPVDLANVVALLCSDDAGWICGQTIVADGGYSLA